MKDWVTAVSLCLHLQHLSQVSVCTKLSIFNLSETEMKPRHDILYKVIQIITVSQTDVLLHLSFEKKCRFLFAALNYCRVKEINAYMLKCCFSDYFLSSND